MEAASSSDDDDESAGSFVDERPSRLAEPRGSRRDDDDDDASSTSSSESRSSSSDDGDQDSQHDSDSDGSEVGDRARLPKHDNNEQHISLAERLQRQQEQGVDLRERRERQQKARRVAADRIHQPKNAGEALRPSRNDVAPKRAPKKKSKHAPTEVSSKRADFYNRRFDLNESGIGVEIGKHRYKPVDPRVSNLTGHLDLEHFETNYEFLQEMRQKEIALLKKRISARKRTGRKGTERRRRLGLTNDDSTMEQDQEALKKLLHEKAEFERRQVDRVSHRAVKKQLQEEVAEGKRGVFFPKRKELKRMHLEAKYDELRKRGGDKAVEKAVEKKRKKDKSKDAGLLLGDG